MRWGRGDAGPATGYEVVAERIHKMEEAGGAVGVPPTRGERIEVGYFCGIDCGLRRLMGGLCGTASFE